MRLLFILISFSSFSQTLLKYDYIESWNWSGGWSVGYGNNTGYYTNASVSGNASAAVLGAGNGTSNIEEGLYIVPNITGLSSLYEYEFRFRLGSYKFNSPSATTSGVDVADYVLLYISTDNTNLVQEIKLTGYNNNLYNYNSTELYKLSNGSVSNYTTQFNSYSDIRLRFSGVSQFLARIYVRVNSAGEEWWIDNMELWQITNALPIEFVSFNGNLDSLWWESASEFNNDYYTISHSLDGYTFKDVEYVNGFVYSIEPKRYSIKNTEGSGYFKLSQTDVDGFKTELDIIFIQEKKQRIIINVVNMLGQQVETLIQGQVYLLIYSDGTIQKIIK